MTNNELMLMHQELLYKYQLKKREFPPEEEHYYTGLLDYLDDTFPAKDIRTKAERYMGIVILERPELSLSPKLINSDLAKVLSYQKYTEILENPDPDYYFRSREKMDLKAALFKRLSDGEKILSDIQIARGMSRQKALEFCIDMNMVHDEYVMFCREFGSMTERLLKLRPRLREWIEKEFGSVRRFKKSSAVAMRSEISNEFYASQRVEVKNA